MLWIYNSFINDKSITAWLNKRWKYIKNKTRVLKFLDNVIYTCMNKECDCNYICHYSACLILKVNKTITLRKYKKKHLWKGFFEHTKSIK